MNKFLRIFLTAATLILFGNLLSVNIKAAIIEKKYDRIYELKEDYIQVTETKEINIIQDSYYIDAGTQDGFTIFNPIESDPDLESKLRKTTESIVLKDKNGNNLNFEVEETSNGNLVIKVTINQTITPQNNFKMILTYKSYGLIITSGLVRDMYIPAFSPDYVFEDAEQKEVITTTVKIPESFGEINFARPANASKTENGVNTISFKQEDLKGNTGWIQVGTKQIFNFSIKQPYFASTTIPLVFNRYKIIIPRDLSSGPIKQEVFFTKIFPAPDNVSLDENGNLIAEFKVPAVDDGEIIIEGYATISQDNSVNFRDSGSISDIPQSIVDTNTKDAIFWEVDSEDIQKTKNEVVGSETNVYKVVESLYKYVVSQIDYSQVKKFGINERQGALSTLRGGAAVCMEYSDLFIALVRAAGIPARAAFGSGYSSLEDSDSSRNAINHQWAEVYIPSLESWIAVDTTWGENGDLIIGGDLNHFYSHVASVDPETPSTTQAVFYGQTNNLVDREMSVSTTAKTSVELSETQSQLLEKYPASASSSDLQDGISLFFSKVNSATNEFLGSLGIPVRYYSLVKFAFISIIVLIVLIILTTSILKSRRNRREIRRLQTIAQTQLEQ